MRKLVALILAALTAACTAGGGGGMAGTDSPVWVVTSIDFDNDPLDASTTWTDVSDYVIGSVDTFFGAQPSVGTVQPGVGSTVLDNADRRFDPTNTAGPYYGQLLPRRRIKAEATDGVTTWPMSFGYVEGWPQDYTGQLATVELRWTDSYTLLARAATRDYYDWLLYDSGNWGAPKAHYKLDATEPYVFDSSGNGHHGEWVVEEPVSAGIWRSALRQWPDHGSYAVDRIPPSTSGRGVDFRTPMQNIVQFESGAQVPRPAALLPSSARLTGSAWTISLWVRFTAWSWGTGAGEEYPGAIFRQGPLANPLDGSLPQSVIQIHTSGNAKPAAPYATLHDETGTLQSVLNGVDVSLGDDAPHHIMVVRNGIAFAMWVDGVQLDVNVLPGAWTVNDAALPIIGGSGSGPVSPYANTSPLGAIDEVTLWDEALVGADAVLLYDAGMAALDGQAAGARLETLLDTVTGLPHTLDLDGGTVGLGGVRWAEQGSVLDAAKAVTAADGGIFFQDAAGALVFHDQAHHLSSTRSQVAQLVLTDRPDLGYTTTPEIAYTGLRYDFDETGLATDVELGWVGGTVKVHDDAARSAYGPIVARVDTSIGDAFTAQVRAAALLADVSTPKLRPVVQCEPVTAAATGALVDLELSDRVLLVRHPPGGGDPISSYHSVIAIRHRHSEGAGPWQTTLTLSEATIDGVAFARDVWDTGVWDTATWE